MGRCFNTTGCCDPELHYMADIRERLSEIKKMVDDGKYFTVNRARQQSISGLSGTASGVLSQPKKSAHVPVRHPADVYDVKNLRRNIRPDEEHKVNSPWNTAADSQQNRIFKAAAQNENQFIYGGRLDVVVDYGGEQFVVELKIWRGNAYHERGEQQLSDYLNYFHLAEGLHVKL